MPDRLPLAAKLPFIPSSATLAIRKAKQLRLQFPSLSLGRARETYARVIAFKDWHAMEQAMAAGQPPGVTDELLTPEGLRARQAWQVQAASTFAELPENEISSFLKAWNPTGPSRSKSVARTTAHHAQAESARPKGPIWEQPQTYEAALQLDGLSPDQRLRLELMPWPAVRAQVNQMARALETEIGLPTERCRKLAALAINRNLPVSVPISSSFRNSKAPSPLGDEILEAALSKFEALGVYESLVPPHHLSGIIAKLRQTAKLPEVDTFVHRTESYSGDLGIVIQNFLAETVIPERIESTSVNQLAWLDKAWYSLKTELGEELGARAWSAMMGLPPAALEYVRDWVENAPGRSKGTYSITEARHLMESKKFERRLRTAGIFSAEPEAQEQTTVSRWLRPGELAKFMKGVDKATLDHGPYSVCATDALHICRDSNAAIQLSMTLTRCTVGDVRIIYVHSIACDATTAKRLFRAGWPFAYMRPLDREVAAAINSQTGTSMNETAYQLHSRKAPTRRF